MDEIPAQHPARRRVLVWAVGLVGIVMAAAALVLPSVLRHDPTKGPLELTGGGLGMSPPKAHPDRWTASFATSVCLRRGDSATLRKVTWLEQQGDGTIRNRFWSIEPDGERPPEGFLGLRGDPTKVITRTSGGALDRLRNHEVTTPCSDDRRYGIESIVTSTTVGEDGMTLSGVRVEYEMDGKDYVVTDREIRYAACSARPEPGDWCSEE